MSNFKPFKFLKDYSKQHPLRFYSILCVVSATAYGEIKFRSMRRKELLVEGNNEAEPKNEYEQYLISQKKMKENQISLDEERIKFKNLLDKSNNNGDSLKKETLLNNTKEKLNQLKSNVESKKKIVENNEKIKNTKKNISEGMKIIKDNSKKLSNKISKENLTSKVKSNTKKLSNKISKENLSSKLSIRKSLSKKSSENLSPSTSETQNNENEIATDNEIKDNKNKFNLSYFHSGNEKFKNYFQRITKNENSTSNFKNYNNYKKSTNRNESVDDEIYSEELTYDINQPERAIFLYDINSPKLNNN